MDRAENIQQVHVNDVELAYFEQGTGEPLLFVHGSLSDYRTWAPQLDAFAERYRVITYSRRFHWPNTQPSSGDTYRSSDQVGDLIALIETLDIAPVHVVCESFGGVVTVAAANERPDLFRTLVLDEPPLWALLDNVPGGDAAVDAFMTEVFQAAGQALERGYAREGARLFLDGVLGPGAFDSLPSSVQDEVLANASALHTETSTPPTEHFPSISREDFSRLDKPVLLVQGEFSPSIFGMVSDELAKMLPNVERAIIQDASHIMNAQNPPAFNETVLGFLSRH